MSASEKKSFNLLNICCQFNEAAALNLWLHIFWANLISSLDSIMPSFVRECSACVCWSFLQWLKAWTLFLLSLSFYHFQAGKNVWPTRIQEIDLLHNFSKSCNFQNIHYFQNPLLCCCLFTNTKKSDSRRRLDLKEKKEFEGVQLQVKFIILKDHFIVFPSFFVR